MEWFDNLIRRLYNNLPQKAKEVSRSDILRDYYNNKYPTKPVYYRGRVLQGSNTRFKVDVRDFFSLNDENLNNIVKSLKLGAQTDNQKALNCIKWIIQNFPYKSDTTNYSQREFWCMPYESLFKKSGDCEDGAILLANMLLVAGIPNWKVRIVTGFVFEPISKKQVGHAYVTFFDEENEKWVILDWCYYPNIKKIIDRGEYKKETMYQDIWFSFNNTSSWGRDSDLRKDEVKILLNE
jgi:predicted transglutaminase-like cysteine proteinase